MRGSAIHAVAPIGHHPAISAILDATCDTVGVGTLALIGTNSSRLMLPLIAGNGSGATTSEQTAPKPTIRPGTL